MTKLSDTQITILKSASKRSDGNIEPLPSNVKPNIKSRVINALLSRNLIEQRKKYYVISSDGLKAIGLKKLIATSTSGKITKQAKMIALMKRPEGASIEEICLETGWQKHTVRGVFSNTIKKRLKLSITSSKDDQSITHYRLA